MLDNDLWVRTCPQGMAATRSIECSCGQSSVPDANLSKSLVCSSALLLPSTPPPHYPSPPSCSKKKDCGRLVASKVTSGRYIRVPTVDAFYPKRVPLSVRGCEGCVGGGKGEEGSIRRWVGWVERGMLAVHVTHELLCTTCCDGDC